MPLASVSQPRLKPSLSQRKSVLVLLAQNDVRLIAKVRAGSEPAFEALVHRHSNRLLSYTRHMLGDQHEAEEAVQQTFLNAYRSIKGSDKEINFKPWVYRIARNQCISMLRAKPPSPEDHIDGPDVRGLSEKVEQREELRAMLQDLERLPNDQRTALLLTELEVLSHNEIADVIECDKDKVKSLVFMARTSLTDSRKARGTECDEIRGQLSISTGGLLRRKVIRNHLRQCVGCREFRDEVKLQRAALSVVLPVAPMFAMAKGGFVGAALASAGGTGSGSAAGAGGAATGGASAAGSSGAGLASAVAAKVGTSALVVKAAAVVVTAGVVAGGAVAANEAGVFGGSKSAESTQVPSSSQTPATGGTEKKSATQDSSKKSSSNKKKKNTDKKSKDSSKASSNSGSTGTSQGSNSSQNTSSGSAPSTGSQSSQATSGGSGKSKGKSQGLAKGKQTAPGQVKDKTGSGSDNAAVGKGKGKK